MIDRIGSPLLRSGAGDAGYYYLALLSGHFGPDVYPLNFAFIDGQCLKSLIKKSTNSLQQLKKQFRTSEYGSRAPKSGEVPGVRMFRSSPSVMNNATGELSILEQNKDE